MIVLRSALALEELKSLTGLEEITTVEVKHRGPCYGIVVKHTDGWSIV
jgi:ribonuclease Z